jgi:cystathionine beta-lyase family protein involved in aluminum resistance
MTAAPQAKRAEALRAGEAAIAARGPAFDATAEMVQRKLLRAFQAAGVTEADLGSGTGYGYGDRGREAVERVFAAAFNAPRALVRTQLVSGTHALATALLGTLRRGDLLLSATGQPYDTLVPIIGPGPGSLADNGVAFAVLDPWEGKGFDPEIVIEAVRRRGPRMVFVQRSRGYSARPALGGVELRSLLERLREAGGTGMIILVDNCYSEFVEAQEPTAYGADLLCGSLIKNPGGGIVPTGGYIAGSETLVETAAARLFAPGLGSAVGPLLLPARTLLQGLFLAPGAVASALKTAVYAAAVFEALGYDISPEPGAQRGDIIQSVTLGSRDLLASFCRAIQAASPVDASAAPEYAPMPGYDHDVIMAAGTFVQGATLELSADAPDVAPHRVYLQGGLGLGYGKAAVENAARVVMSQDDAGAGENPKRACEVSAKVC